MKKQKGIFEYLGVPGIISILGLTSGWIAIVLLIIKLPFLAVSASIIAFYFDCLDGYIARKTHTETEFGRQLDGLFDLFNYSVFSALLFWMYIYPNILGIIVGFVILSTSAFRLIRFNIEGFVIKDKQLYYAGFTVGHILLTTILLFFAYQFIPHIILIIAIPIMIIISILQTSRILIKKTGTYTFWLSIAFLLLIISLALHVWQG